MADVGFDRVFDVLTPLQRRAVGRYKAGRKLSPAERSAFNRAIERLREWVQANRPDLVETPQPRRPRTSIK